MDSLFISSGDPFPLDLKPFEEDNDISPVPDNAITNGQGDDGKVPLSSQGQGAGNATTAQAGTPVIIHHERPPATGTLLGPARLRPGETSISLHIYKLGIKDAPRYKEPHLAVYIVDSQGQRQGVEQCTPVASSRTPTSLIFKAVVHLQISLERCAEDMVVIIELRHYKEEHDYVSTRCWSLLERDELTRSPNTPVCLEIYRKPVSITTPVHLFTEKDLYLHTMIKFVKN